MTPPAVSDERGELLLLLLLQTSAVGNAVVLASISKRDAAKQQATTLDPSTGSSETVQVRGFLLKSYMPTEANVDLAFETSGGKLFHAVLPLQWLDGDWKVKVSDAGQLINDVAPLSDMSGFISWAGV